MAGRGSNFHIHKTTGMKPDEPLSQMAKETVGSHVKPGLEWLGCAALAGRGNTAGVSCMWLSGGHYLFVVTGQMVASVDLSKNYFGGSCRNMAMGATVQL